MLERLRLIDGVSAVTLQSSDQGQPAAVGGCPANGPAFTVTVQLRRLPTRPPRVPPR